jgi:hypothetical protein
VTVPEWVHLADVQININQPVSRVYAFSLDNLGPENGTVFAGTCHLIGKLYWQIYCHDLLA